MCATLPFCERVVSIPRSRYLPSHNRGIPVPKQPTTIGGHLRKRRLQLQIHQSEAAVRLKVSTVTLSRWECDKVYPTWEHQPRLIEYLGYDPFVSCGLQDPYGNEPPGVAFLSSDTPWRSYPSPASGVEIDPQRMRAKPESGR